MQKDEFMHRIETVGGIMGAAGIGLFGVAAFLSGFLPIFHVSRTEYKTLEQITPAPSTDFVDLSVRFPEAFKKAFGQPTVESYRAALRLGRDRYIAEACWHCHSQYVRPVSNEDVRFGKVSWAAEYRNEMFLPHLFGTRRVGPDLIRESGKHGNDWHVAHFFDPTLVTPSSVMPRYSWFFDGDVPNKVGLAMITYMQWLGSWATPEVLEREALRAKEAAAGPTVATPPSAVPATAPTAAPTAAAVSAAPTAAPTAAPPTAPPAVTPTAPPTALPTAAPSTAAPASVPPAATPTSAPAAAPAAGPTALPSAWAPAPAPASTPPTEETTSK